MPAKSIQKFCHANDISRARYYGMKAEGLGPREMNNGSRVTITDEAETEWRILLEVLRGIVDLPGGKERTSAQRCRCSFLGAATLGSDLAQGLDTRPTRTREARAPRGKSSESHRGAEGQTRRS